jgi:hypothetical protein
VLLLLLIRKSDDIRAASAFDEDHDADRFMKGQRQFCCDIRLDFFVNLLLIFRNSVFEGILDVT